MVRRVEAARAARRMVDLPAPEGPVRRVMRAGARGMCSGDGSCGGVRSVRVMPRAQAISAAVRERAGGWKGGMERWSAAGTWAGFIGGVGGWLRGEWWWMCGAARGRGVV